MTTRHWVERDARRRVARLHPDGGLCATTRPIVVERAEGHELIDVDGKRYLDAISSLWVTTLGHRVPELDDGAPRADSDRVAHSTLLGNGNTRGDRAGRGARARSSRSTIRTSCSPPTARPRSSRRSRSRSSTGRTRRRGRDAATSRSATPTTATRSARSRSATAASAPTSSIRCASRCCARPGSTTRRACEARRTMVREHADELAAVVVEPLVQGAAGMQLGRPERLRSAGARRARSPTCCSSATRSPPASGAPARCSRPNSAGSAPTSCVSARASPAATCRCRRPSPTGASSTRSSARTSAAHPLPRSLVRRERARRGRRAPPSRAARRTGRPRRTSRARSAQLASSLDDRIAPLAAGGRGPARAG